MLGCQFYFLIFLNYVGHFLFMTLLLSPSSFHSTAATAMAFPFSPKTFHLQTHQQFHNWKPLPQTKTTTPFGFSQIMGFDKITRKASRTMSHLLLNQTNYSTSTGFIKEVKQPEEKKPQVADTWKYIHGEDDWVGMLDPMDPLLRTELIRYGEMSQACYDAFDFDPYSKYCGACRFERQNFFRGLGIGTEIGYDVTRYIYATSNINLPNFFKKSRWPKVWSKNANWIGYIAVSNEEMTKKLGRRDITIAWRGTVTRLEWIADLMDFLKPISADKIPCPDPRVKVESGFVDLYTDKDESCRFCKFSAREQILAELKRLIDMFQNEELSITITGKGLNLAS